MGYAKIFRDYTGPNRKFSSFCIGEFFMSDDDIFVKVADGKALNLSTFYMLYYIHNQKERSNNYEKRKNLLSC